MTRNRPPRILPSALLLPAIAFLIVAQLALALAPLMEGRFGADARPHVEADGTNTHHAHNAADCAACAARGLLATAKPSAPVAIESPQSVIPGLSERDEHFAFLTVSQSRPRAPPFGQA